MSDATLTSRMSAVRRAIGDTGEHQELIRTIPRRGFRFIGVVREHAGDVADFGSIAATKTVGDLAPDARLNQEIQFCSTSDGAYLAFSVVGTGPPLVKTANWLNHLEFDWHSPVWSPLFTRLAARNCLIRYDERGTGLSDREARTFPSKPLCTTSKPSSMLLGSIALRCLASHRARPLLSRMRFATRTACPGWCYAADLHRGGAGEAMPKTWPGRKRRSRLFATAGRRTIQRPVKCSRR